MKLTLRFRRGHITDIEFDDGEKTGNVFSQRPKYEDERLSIYFEIFDDCLVLMRSFKESSVIISTLRQFLPGSVFEISLLKEAESLAFHSVQDSSQTELYFDKSSFIRLAPKISGWGDSSRVIHKSSIIFYTHLVTEVDFMLTRIFQASFTLKEDFLKSSGKTISVEEVLRASSIQEIKERIISKESESFTRGNLREKMDMFNQRFSVDCKRFLTELDLYRELFEIRNCIVHNDAIPSDLYNREFKQMPNRIGCISSDDGRFVISPNFFSESIEKLSTMLMLTILTLLYKIFNSEKEMGQIDGFLNERAVQLISNQLEVCAIPILETRLDGSPKFLSDQHFKMCTINLAQSYKWSGQEDKCKQLIKKIDWSSTSIEYKICVAALSEDYDFVFESLETFGKHIGIDKIGFEEWPIFKKLREDIRFYDKISEVFD